MTALAEKIGCYLPCLWLRDGKSVWLLIPAALSLAAFVWLQALIAKLVESFSITPGIAL